MRRITTMFLCLLGCSGDSDDDGTTTAPITTTAPTTPSAPVDDTTAGTDPTTAATTSTTTDTTSTPTTSEPMTTSPATSVTSSTGDITTSDDTTGAPVDCNAPPDCATCWTCAKQGACKAAYDACAFVAFCIPSLTCIESMCTPGGLQPDCAATCCMSCGNLGTCNDVDAALECILPMCAAQCGQSTCGG